MSNPAASTRIRQIRTLAKIEAIYHVDDDFAELGTVLSCAISEIGDEAWRRAPVRIAEEDRDADRIESDFGSYRKKYTKAALKEWAQALRPIDQFTATARKLFGTKRESCLSLKQWKERGASILRSGSALLVFDNSFTREGGDSQDGIQELRNHADLIVNNGHAVVLFTQQVADWDASLALEESVGEQLPALRDRLVVAPKLEYESGGDDVDRLVAKIRLAILSSKIAPLRNRISVLLREVASEAADRLEGLSPEAFESIALHSSHIEGLWAGDTLARVFTRTVENRLTSSVRSQELFAAAREVNELSKYSISRHPSESAANAALSLRMEEIYRLDMARHNGFELELGDIFFDEKLGRFLILLAQPCDLLVRDKGRRNHEVSPDAARAVLLPISFEPPDRAHEVAYELPAFPDRGGESVWALLNSARTKPLPLLDLCVVAPDGRCRIPDDWALARESLPPSWVARCDVLREALESNGALGSEVHNSALHRRYRLLQPYSGALLSKYAAYLSRPAYPHDLTRHTMD